MPLQGRVGDNARCPSDSHGAKCCPHVAVGPGTQGSPDVTVNGKPALRVGDPGDHSAGPCTHGGSWTASAGSATVTINGKPAHRLGDPTVHCGGSGTLEQGSPDVDVGDVGASGASGGHGKSNGAQAAPEGTQSVALGSRPVYGQEEGMSCGPAAARMAIATMTGNDIPEAELRRQSSTHGFGGYNPNRGTSITSVERLMRDNGVDVQGVKWFGNVSDIQSSLGPARPAVALLNDPGHFVVVDEVRGTTAGQRTLVVRDPWYGERTMSEADFNKRFSGHFIRINP